MTDHVTPAMVAVCVPALVGGALGALAALVLPGGDQGDVFDS